MEAVRNDLWRRCRKRTGDDIAFREDLPTAGREDWTDALKNPFRLILRSDFTLIAI